MFNLPLPVTYMTYHLYAIHFDVCLVFCSYFVISSISEFAKGQFISKSKTHISPLTCGANHSLRLFWCELPTLGRYQP